MRGMNQKRKRLGLWILFLAALLLTQFTVPVKASEPQIQDVNIQMVGGQIRTIDPNLPNEEKTKIVNNRISEIAREYPTSSGTTIVLTYVKDETQTKPTNYTVKHIVGGEEEYSHTYNGTAWINETI